MSDVQFEENNYAADRFRPIPTKMSFLVGLVFKIGLVKTEKQANYVLIGVALCAVLLTVWVIKSSFGSVRSNSNDIPADVLKVEQAQKASSGR